MDTVIIMKHLYYRRVHSPWTAQYYAEFYFRATDSTTRDSSSPDAMLPTEQQFFLDETFFQAWRPSKILDINKVHYIQNSDMIRDF
jgi:hypothetical protein